MQVKWRQLLVLTAALLAVVLVCWAAGTMITSEAFPSVPLPFHSYIGR